MLNYIPEILRGNSLSCYFLSNLSTKKYEESVFNILLDKVIEEAKDNVDYIKKLNSIRSTSLIALRSLFFNTVFGFNNNSLYSIRRSYKTKPQQAFSEFISSFTTTQLDLNYYELETINSALPLFSLPSLNRAAKMQLPSSNLYSDYTSLSCLTLKDLRKIHLANDEDTFQKVLKELADEFKINSFYTKTNETDEYIKNNFIEISTQTFYKYFNSNYVTPDLIKNYMKVRLEGLKFIASSVIYFKKIVFKSLLTLKMDNNFADLNDTEHPSYSKFIEQNTDSNRSTQFYLNNSFSPLKFENNTYSNIKETENKIRIVKHYDFAKTKEASVVRDINNLKVYSIFPKEWLDNFTSLSVVNKKIHFQKQLPTELYFTKLQETEFSLSVGQLDDFSFVGDFYLHLSETENTLIDNNLSETNSLYSLPSLLNSAIYPNKEVVNLSTLFSESITFTNGKTNALVFNNFCTGSQPFSFEIKQVTKTQLLNSNNMFVPIAFKTTRIVYDNLETTLPLEEDIYYLSFVNFNNIENTFRKFTKCQKFLQYFDRLLCTENSQAISNPQIYEEELAQRFGKILKYSKLQKDKFERIGCDFINRFTNQNPKVNSLINPSRLSFLNGKLNIDEKVLNKLQKSKETKDKINEKLTIELNNLYKLINEEEENKSKIKDLQQEIQSFTNLIKEKTLEIETINRDSQTLPVEIEKQKTKYEKQEKLNQTFMLSFNEVVKEYEEQEKQALENNNFIPDSFFDGLSSKGLFLTELGLQQYDDPVVFYDCQKIQNLTKDTYSKSKIVSLDFVIAKPFAIKVDGDSENLIYAGPLKVRVTNESIQVAALNTSSIFAFISENTAALHPHACSFGIYKDMNLNDLWLYKRGCLGEASPYLYNSFKENSLKMIIVNCLVWLTSANSSDAWGKNYKFFPKKNDINLNNLESPAIDVDSLIDFIKDSEEENSSDFQNQEQTLYFGNPEEEIDPTYCEHDHDERGHCIYCGDYDADFDESYAQEDENNEYENEEAVLPENIVQQTYTPFFTLTNTNNNER